MKKLIIKYIEKKKLYKKTVLLLRLRIFLSKNLEDSINNYGEIKRELKVLLNEILNKDEDYKYIDLLIISLYENIDSVLENLIISNYDTCLKIIRSISEQLIIFKCLMQNEKSLMEDFFHWSILNDYKNPKNEVELASTVKELYDRYNLNIERYILKKEKNINEVKLKKYKNQLIDSNYGWYYTRWKVGDPISLKYIAKNEKCEEIYEMFEYYSEKVHNNNTRTLIIQSKHNLSMEYHILELLLFTQKHIIEIIKKYIHTEKYNDVQKKILENIQYNYEKMKYCEENFDK